jgi:hypothetical protein
LLWTGFHQHVHSGNRQIQRQCLGGRHQLNLSCSLGGIYSVYCVEPVSMTEQL